MYTRSVIRRSVIAAAMAGSVLVVAPAAYAYDKGDFIFRAGVAGTRVNDDLKIDIGSPPLFPGNFVKGSLKRSDVGAGLNLTYMFTDHIGLDFMLTNQFSHKYTIDRNVFPIPVLSPPGALKYNAGTIKQMPLMLTGLYFPMDKQAAFQPYVGAGVHYTINKTTFTPQFKSDLVLSTLMTAAQVDAREKKLNKNNWGFTGVIGADYNVNKNWLVNAQVRYLTITSSQGRLVYMAGVGYRF